MTVPNKTAKRKQLMAQIHIAKKDLGLDDESYRAILWRVSQKESCADMTVTQLVDVVKEMKRLGFKVQSTARSKANHGKKPNAVQSKQALMNKIEAILADMNLSWAYAHAMARKMFGVDQVHWLDDNHLYKLTQALAVYQRKQKVKQYTS